MIMKREILFKAKRIDNNEWVFGYYIFRPDGSHLIYWKPFDEATQNTYHHVKSETVCQFTGLLDKNDNKIFEGDIIDTEKSPMKVVYRDGCFYCESESYYRLGGWSKETIEVRYNIHDILESKYV